MLFCYVGEFMRILSLDIGEKRIGIAMSDPLGITASGLMTLERVGVRKDCDKIIALIDEHKCEKVVIGLPLMLDGSFSPQTEKVREFARILKNITRTPPKIINTPVALRIPEPFALCTIL